MPRALVRALAPKLADDVTQRLVDELRPSKGAIQKSSHSLSWFESTTALDKTSTRPAVRRAPPPRSFLSPRLISSPVPADVRRRSFGHVLERWRVRYESSLGRLGGLGGSRRRW